MKAVVCPYCETKASLVGSERIYGPGKDYGKFWLCEECGAYVGTHKNSDYHAPLGTLANTELRQWRRKAHDCFDVIWQHKASRERLSKSAARGMGYQWLAGQLGIEKADCHIGQFDLETCKRVVHICAPYTRGRSGMKAV